MSDEHGMTLVELMVAMAMSVIVIFGAIAVITSTLNVTQQVTGRTTALGQGRTGMEALLAQLNSGCLVPDVSPVQASTSGISSISPAVNSDANDLVFVSGVNDSATPTPTLHVVTVRGGALIDSAYAYSPLGTSVLNQPSTWHFASTTSQVLELGDHVSAGGGQMFSYYAYPTAAPYSLSNPVTLTGLTTTTAPTVAEVDMAIRFQPSATDPSGTTSSQFNDSAVFSLTADSDTAQNSPCE